MLSLYMVNPKLGDGVYDLLSPGSDVLAKWLPVFFVPSLVTLPLAPSLGSSMELLKVAVVIIGGFYFTLFSTAYSVIGIRKLFPSSTTKESNSSPEATSTSTSITNTPPPKAFSDQTFNALSIGTILTGIATILTTTSSTLSPLVKTPIQTSFMLLTTLLSFTFGARLPKSIISIIHPLIICTSLTLGMTKVLSLIQNLPFLSTLTSYKVGSLCPVHLGAGDVLLYMLGPAVIALSCQMYNKKKLMKENLKEITAGISVSSIGGLIGTSYLVRLLNISNPILKLSCLSRNITSPLAMAISSILGGDVSLAVSMVVVTGLIGANFGSNILDKANVNDPVARGLSIGSAAHGLGTAAFKDEKDAFPFAAIGMALTASACTVLVSIPTVKKLILKIALGV
jgi:putative effector of murein hydrolase